MAEMLDTEFYAEMAAGPRDKLKLPDVKANELFTRTVKHILDAVKQEDEDRTAAPGSGGRVGQLLAAAYHNCAVQQEALGEIPAALASVEVALALARPENSAQFLECHWNFTKAH